MVEVFYEYILESWKILPAELRRQVILDTKKSE